MEQLPSFNVPYEVHPRCFHSLASHLQFPDHWRGLPRLLESVTRRLGFVCGAYSRRILSFFPSLSISVEMSVLTAQFGRLTARCTPFTWIAGITKNVAVNSTDRLEGKRMKITLVCTSQPTLRLAALRP